MDHNMKFAAYCALICFQQDMHDDYPMLKILQIFLDIPYKRQ